MMMKETTDTAHIAMTAYTALRMKKLSIVGRIYVSDRSVGTDAPPWDAPAA